MGQRPPPQRVGAAPGRLALWHITADAGTHQRAARRLLAREIGSIPQFLGDERGQQAAHGGRLGNTETRARGRGQQAVGLRRGQHRALDQAFIHHHKRRTHKPHQVLLAVERDQALNRGPRILPLLVAVQLIVTGRRTLQGHARLLQPGQNIAHNRLKAGPAQAGQRGIQQVEVMLHRPARRGHLVQRRREDMQKNRAIRTIAQPKPPTPDLVHAHLGNVVPQLASIQGQLRAQMADKQRVLHVKNTLIGKPAPGDQLVHHQVEQHIRVVLAEEEVVHRVINAQTFVVPARDELNGARVQFLHKMPIQWEEVILPGLTQQPKSRGGILEPDVKRVGAVRL